MTEPEKFKLTPWRDSFERTVADKDINLEDGRVLEFYGNIPVPNDHSDSSVHNRYNSVLYLARRGVVALPEVSATDMAGVPLSRPYLAEYVDDRIGRGKLLEFSHYWLRENDARFRASVNTGHEQVIPREELSEILERGIKETGIGAILEQMRAEDATRTSQAPELDINAIMRNMRDQSR